MRANTVRTFATLALLGLVLASCSSPEGSEAGPAPSRSAEDSAADATPGPTGSVEGGGEGGGRVPEVLRFSAPRLGGGTVEGEDFSGEDVALWFWAPW
ncbi:MAG TPA: hypothetical protein VFI59_08055 [Actinomycetota bacterium]|nr:hypothetical protein [Actinomycetota bacterium]